ncbi:MAG: bifunctional 5,10-methylenetetrahydrofolate dehydrogenase/5,10-methenyltetrahydrofolate cyclohydrolase [Erysipelotrichaceae bacterium]|nr:bifunctional 5,10-methylenetetrahydrofolate dehydrogenase/5,10-methenyltetrahydrofolate cyclohydrolase [Erysipelotrichaceae bacterium]
MGNIMYGNTVSTVIKETLKQEITSYIDKGLRKPTLAILLVGHDEGSISYVKSITKGCDAVGIDVKLVTFEDSVSQETIVQEIDVLNKDHSIDGIIIQMPLPKHINTQAVIECMDPSKDVDGLTSRNVAKMYMNQKCMIPCTPKAVMRMLKEYNIELVGKEVVVIGRSHSVGRPVAQLLVNENATVTICHSKTKNLAEVCKRAEILVVAIGRPRYVKAEWVQSGAIVVDVGVNMDENGKLCGDVDFDEILEKASYVTPVPRGVGPVTTTMLLENVVESFKGRMK